MNLKDKSFFIAVTAILTLFLGMLAVAQGPADLSTSTSDAAATTPDPVPNPVPQSPPGAGDSDNWRIGISVYGWFPGLHGTIGALGHNAGVHVPFSDALSYP